MKDHNNYPKCCLGERASSFSPTLLLLLFLSAISFGPLGPVVAISVYLLMGHLIVNLPKIAGRANSVIPRMPMWGVGLTLATLLAVAGFGYAWFHNKPTNVTKPTNPVRTRILQAQPFVMEETHIGDIDSCRDCETLIDNKDPDIAQWKQSKSSHTVTLTIFAKSPIPKITNPIERSKYKENRILHDEYYRNEYYAPQIDNFKHHR